jgi:hypothetical protein
MSPDRPLSPTMLKAAIAIAVLTLTLGARADEPSSTRITSTLSAWTRRPVEEMRPWGDAMAAVCASDDECLLLASQAFVESRFMPWVVDESCNDDAWRERQPGWIRKSCDGGLAYGPWQIHDPSLYGATPLVQVRAAVKILRENPRAWTTWKAARSQAAWWRARSGS